MRQQRGIADGWLILIALAVLTGALWYAYNVVDGRGYARGAAEIQNKWDTANREAQEAADAARVKAAAIVAEERGKRLKAEAQAEDATQKWREARNAARKLKTATVVSVPARVADASPDSPVASLDPDPRFTWGWVRLYDAAWTGPAGKPLFVDPATAAAPDAGAASPHGPGEVLDTHKENARRFDICRRDLNTLMDTIERLQGGKP